MDPRRPSASPAAEACTAAPTSARQASGAERLQQLDVRIMEAISSGLPLATVLEMTVLGVESVLNDGVASVLLPDASGRRLQHGAAPHLPDSYNRRLDGLPVSPRVGSCGTAAHDKKPVRVADIGQDPLWADYPELAHQLIHEEGLRACWSTPVLDANGRVLATFAIYQRQSRLPSDEDQELIDHATHLVRLAIEHDQREQALRMSEARLAGRVRQQEMLARLSLEAMRSTDLPATLQTTTAWMTEVLNLEFGKVLQLNPEGTLFRLVAGTGWNQGVVGSATVGAGKESQAGFTLLAHTPVHVSDLRQETRFAAPPLLSEHGVRSGMSVAIEVEGRPWGVLAVHSAAARAFTDEDTHFLQAIANLLSVTISRFAAQESLSLSERHLQAAQRIGRLGSWDYDLQTHQLTVSPELYEIFGFTAGRCTPPPPMWLERVHPEDAPQVRHWLRAALRQNRPINFEYRIVRADGELRHVHERGEVARQADGKPLRIIGTIQDITERKVLAERLRASEENFRRTFQDAATGIAITTLDGRFLEANDAYCRMLGHSEAELRQMNLATVTHPDDLPANLTLLDDLVRGTRESFVIEKRYLAKGGRPVWSRVSVSAQRDADGRPLRLIGVAEDITDLKNAELELRRTAVRLENTLASITDAFFILDRNWNFTYLNPEAERLLRRPHRELEGRNLWTEFPEAAGSAFEREYRRAFEQNLTVGFEEHYPSLKTWFEVRAYPSEEGLAVYFRDVTARRSSEEQLRLLQACISRINDVVIITDAAGKAPDDPKIVYVNDAFEQHTGYTRAEMLGQSPRLLLGPLTCAESRARIRAALAAGQAVRAEVVNRSKAGADLWMEVDLVPVQDASGRPSHWVAIARDIGERKRAEERLQASEARFREMADNIGDVFYNYDPIHHRLLYANPAYERMWGRPLADVLADPLVYLNGIHPEDRPEAEAAFQAHLQGRATEVEFRVVRPDGSVCWVREQAVPIVDANGRVERIVGTMRDINARRLAENRLMESEARFRELAENVEDVFYSFDPVNRRQLYVSPAYERIWGRPLAVQQNDACAYLEAVHPEDRPAAEKARREKEAGRPVEVTYRILRPDGETRWIRDNSVPVLDADGRVVRTVGSARDITDIRRSAERLAEQASLLDKAQDAILVRNLNHEVLYWNHSAELLYGWTAAEAVGRSITDLIYHEVAEFEAATAATLARGEWTGEIRHWTKSNQVKTIEGHWTLVRDDLGRPKSILAINTDITERKRLEQQFLRSQRMESIGTLAGGVAHDLNNVLTPILMAIELLKAAEQDPARLRILATIEASAQRGADMVQQVLSFARGVDGQRVEVRVSHLLGEIEKIVRETFDRRIAVSTRIPDDLWIVQGDPTQLHQVLLNLCVNARDAMPEGGRLSLSAANVPAGDQESGGVEHPQVVLEVEDTGCGMAPEVLERIFEPFFTTKAVGKGTGLGLSTTLAIVKSHGGSVQVSSEAGAGARFRVCLPARQAPASPPSSAGSAELLPRGRGERILVVDDEEATREITRQILEAFGYRTRLAENGSEACRIYRENPGEIAAVITDMMMPVMDGPALIRELQRTHPEVVVITTSGLNPKVNAAQLGARSFIPKPFTAETLLKALAQALQPGDSDQPG